MMAEDDSHFLIDSAPPAEVERALRSLSSEAQTATELRDQVISVWGYHAQESFSFTTRRLVDLGLAIESAAGLKPGYRLTKSGAKLRSILDASPPLYKDAMHYLHYTGSPARRKLFWSYRFLCQIVWSRREVLPASQLTAQVQAQIAAEFPQAYAKKGGNFNKGGVSAWKAWLAQLDPSPFLKEMRDVVPRVVPRFELALLALNDVYCCRGYRYGDPVLLDEQFLDELTCVFFLNQTCFRELIELAVKLTRRVVLKQTFAGTSVNLVSPYRVDDVQG